MVKASPWHRRRHCRQRSLPALLISSCLPLCMPQVLVAHPPPLHLDISTLPEPWLAWLPSMPVQTLRIQSGLDQVRSQPSF